MEPLPTVSKALFGLALAGLLAAVMFLVVGPSVVIETAEINCGVPAMWHFVDQQETTAEVPRFPSGDPLPNCEREVNRRLWSAAISFLAAIACIGAAVFTIWAQARRMRLRWERTTRRIETGQLAGPPLSRRP